MTSEEYLMESGWWEIQHKKNSCYYWQHPNLDGLVDFAEALRYQRSLDRLAGIDKPEDLVTE